MFVTFDYRCRDMKRCGMITSRFIEKDDMNDQICECGASLAKLPAGTRTTFRFADERLKK